MSWERGLEDGSHTIGRWLTDRAARSPRRIAIDDRGVHDRLRHARPSRDELGRRTARGRLRPRASRCDDLGQLHRARRRVLRLRTGRHRVRAAVVAQHTPRAQPTCCAAPTGARADRRRVRIARRGGAARARCGAADRAARLDRGRRHPFPLLASRGPTSRARRRPAARDLHVGQRGGAEGRRAHPRQLLLEQPRARAGAAAHARRCRAGDAAAVPRRSVELPAAAGLVGRRDGRARTLVPARACSAADPRASSDRDDGRAHADSECSPPTANGRDRCLLASGSHSWAGRRCPLRSADEWSRAG